MPYVRNSTNSKKPATSPYVFSNWILTDRNTLEKYLNFLRIISKSETSTRKEKPRNISRKRRTSDHYSEHSTTPRRIPSFYFSRACLSQDIYIPHCLVEGLLRVPWVLRGQFQREYSLKEDKQHPRLRLEI